MGHLNPICIDWLRFCNSTPIDFIRSPLHSSNRNPQGAHQSQEVTTERMSMKMSGKTETRQSGKMGGNSPARVGKAAARRSGRGLLLLQPKE